jgi:hypothetical protein
MTAGELRPAAFLDAKGKLQTTCLLVRSGGDEVWLETQAHQLEKLLALLERYHFTEKLRTEAIASSCSERVALAGPGERATGVLGASGALGLAFPRRGVVFQRRHSLGGTVLPPLDGAPLDDETAECLRMIAGLCKVGVETEPTTLALEADLDDHVSTQKGCFTGQEIVARIHTYGHTNRALCLLQLAGGPPITVPQTLHEPDGSAVGRVMRAVPVPGRALRLGLGFLPKDFQAAGTALRLADRGEVVVVRGGNGE